MMLYRSSGCIPGGKTSSQGSQFAPFTRGQSFSTRAQSVSLQIPQYTIVVNAGVLPVFIAVKMIPM
jgi:hypothetical protein